MSALKVAHVSYFIDADLRGMAKVLCNLRADITYQGDPGATIHKRRRPPCPVPESAVKDTEWIPDVAARGWLIITRDHNIQQLTHERHTVRDHGARMVNLNSKDASTIWNQLEVLFSRWRTIDELRKRPGPFICNLSRTGKLIDVPLD